MRDKAPSIALPDPLPHCTIEWLCQPNMNSAEISMLAKPGKEHLQMNDLLRE